MGRIELTEWDDVQILPNVPTLNKLYSVPPRPCHPHYCKSGRHVKLDDCLVTATLMLHFDRQMAGIWQVMKTGIAD